MTQEFLINIVDSIADPIFVKNREHKWILLNDAFCRFVGYSRDELLGKSDFEFFPQHEAVVFWAKDESVFANGEENINEEVITDHNGVNHNIITKKSLYTDNSGNSYIVGIIRDITVQRNSEEELNRREQEFTTLVNNSPDVIIRYDTDCRCIYVNPSWSQVSGHQENDIVGKSPIECSVLITENSVEYQETIREVIRTGQSHGLNYNMLDKNGRTTFFDMSAVPELDKDGNIISALTVSRDITERKRMEAELREQANYQQTLLNGLCDVGMVLMITENGRLIHVGNREIAHQFGYSDEEIEEHPLLADIIHPDDRNRVMDYYQRRLAGEDVPTSYELALVTRSGERREYEVAVAVVPNTEPQRIVTIGRDITARKHADTERRMLAEVLEETVDFVGTADMEGRIYFHNRGARQMIGMVDDECFSNMNMSDMHPEWAWKMINEVAMPVVLKDGMWRGESALLHNDGREIPVSQLIMQHKDSNDKPTHTSTIMQDISEVKATEIARENALNEANKLSKMRGTFLSQVTHELRTPLNGILGCVELLLMDESLDEEQRRWISTIKSSGEFLLMFIKDILDYTKFEANKMEIYVDDIHLDKLLKEVVDIVRVNAKRKNLLLDYKADSDLPIIIRCDGLRLRQVLLNLLSNAIKFTDDGEVGLCVKYFPPGSIRFEVRDSGVGIGESDINNIFEPYTQVGDVGRKHAGTGLGLAICQQIVRLMGSEIEVNSRLNQGSCFSFDLNVEVMQAEETSENITKHNNTEMQENLPLSMVVPKISYLNSLHNLAMTGNMRKIISFSNKLADSNSSYVPFTDHLRKLAKSYESKKIVNFISRYLNENANYES